MYCDKSLKTSSDDLSFGHIQFAHTVQKTAWFFTGGTQYSGLWQQELQSLQK